ncbi:MAG: DUF3365 domain-containing protein [Flavobacteriales bacterium]
MKKAIILNALISTSLIVGCSNNHHERRDNSTADDGETLFSKNCQSCHNSKATAGPPTFAIKKRYLSDHPDKEGFSAAIASFVQHPSAENAKLKNAVEKFGLMPPLSYSNEELKSISNYIYDNDFGRTKPKKGKKSSFEDPTTMGPMERGRFYAKSIKTELGKNLMAAINEKGAPDALSFCNAHAIPLTDSLSAHFGVSISRVSDKPRNPKNIANEDEREIISTYKTQLANSEDLKPLLIEEGSGYRFYAPITTNQMCLQCHGSASEDILQATKDEIARLYPQDKATGYGENEVRGIWRIEF